MNLLTYLKACTLYLAKLPALHKLYKPHKLKELIPLITLIQLTSLTQLHKLHKLYKLHKLKELIQLIPPTPLTKLSPPEHRYPINLGHPERIAILLVGLGGTGGWAAHSLAQLAVWARTQGQDLRLTFIDYDSVEPKNLLRQNFCAAEVGNPKAFSLAWRYSAAYGLAITPVVEAFSGAHLDHFKAEPAPGGTLTLVVGAVDNVEARQAIAGAITARLPYLSRGEQLWWLDAGNEQMSGQVVLGNSLEPEPLLSPLGYCLGLPLPHLQEPTLIMKRPQRPTASCADLEQSLVINRMMAAWLSTYLYRLLQRRDLDLMATHLCLSTGVVKSQAITGGRLVLPRLEQPALPAETGSEPCPDCGGPLVYGQDSLGEIVFDVAFCPQCRWRAELCPSCGEVIDLDETEQAGQIIAVIRCEACGWAEEG